MRASPLTCLAALVLALTAGCDRTSDKPVVSLGVRGAPSLVQTLAGDPTTPWKAWRLRAYQTDHIWGGDGPAPKGDKSASYRAKVTVWDDDVQDHDTPLAEIFFRDPDQFQPAGLHRNPNPNDPKDPANRNVQGTGPGRTFRLHFPSSTLGVVLSTLRNANEPVYLYYYDNQWAVGIANAEAVGAD